jgi:hypothetical protein
MMKRMMISAALLLWAGSAYADDRANAVMVVAFSQYEEICNAKVPSSLAELAASAMKKLDADLLEATNTEMLAAIDTVGPERFCKLLGDKFSEYEEREKVEENNDDDKVEENNYDDNDKVGKE